MLKKYFHLLFIISFLFPKINNAQSNYFYYYKGDKIYLELDRSAVLITTNEQFQENSIYELDILPYNLKNMVLESTNEEINWAIITFTSISNEIEYLQKLNALKNTSGIEVVSPSYVTTDGHRIGTSSLFYVKLNQPSDFDQLEQLAIESHVIIDHQNRFMPLWYTLKLTGQSLLNTLEMANFFYESGLFKASEPDFLADDLLGCTNDPNFDQLWGMQNNDNPSIDINVCNAWGITEGDGVKVAVIDNGIELTHIDLQDNIESDGYNTHTGAPPSQVLDDDAPSHGTHVGGTIGAVKDNNLHVVGVAPQSKLISISNNMDYFPGNEENFTDGINWAWQNGADIINNSWWYPLQTESMDDAIENALNNGRGGLGTIVVFIAGNDNLGDVVYPAMSHPDILVVSSIDSNGELSMTSSIGNEVDISAPGVGILSTTNGNSIGLKNGTSMAAPHVSGIAALVLSVNPCLSVLQVNDIIENTAQKISEEWLWEFDNYEYAYYENRPNGTWNELMGYGLVDAYAAVQLAQQLNSPTLDLHIKNSSIDYGIEPDDVTQFMWTSTDIWIRNIADEIPEHQNPEFDPEIPNYVYVNVVNKSCVASSGNEVLKLYWAKANTSLSWPQHWDGSLYEEGVLMGAPIAELVVPVLDPGEKTTLEFEWLIPNPEDYQDINDNPWHFCLLTRLEAEDDPMTVTEGTSVYSNTKKNNNIAWKNVTAVDIIPNFVSNIGAVFAVGNPYSETRSFNLEFLVSDDEAGKAIYDEAEVTIEFDEVLYQSWLAEGKNGENFKHSNDPFKNIVTNNYTVFENITLNPGELGTIYVTFNFLTKQLTNKTKFQYHVIQRDYLTGEIIGGETFIINKEPRDIFIADAGEDKSIESEELITLSAGQINEAVTYNWYDLDGSLIYTGKELTVAPDITKKYKLEVVSISDGYKDYDEVEIKVSNYLIQNLTPNPATNQVVVTYKAKDAVSAYIMVIGTNDGTSNNYIINPAQTEVILNTSAYQSGFYIIVLVCDGQISDTLTLQKD